MRTGGLGRVPPAVVHSSAPSDILASRHRLEMGRVAATGVATEMVKLQPSGNRTHVEFVGPPMGVHAAPVLVGELAVACRSEAGGPLPASVLLHRNLGPESVLNRNQDPGRRGPCGIPISLPTRVVSATKATPRVALDHCRATLNRAFTPGNQVGAGFLRCKSIAVQPPPLVMRVAQPSGLARSGTAVD